MNVARDELLGGWEVFGALLTFSNAEARTFPPPLLASKSCHHHIINNLT
jgi:hypothetical protein